VNNVFICQYWSRLHQSQKNFSNLGQMLQHVAVRPYSERGRKREEEQARQVC
jgi:hypothetical protein